MLKNFNTIQFKGDWESDKKHFILEKWGLKLVPLYIGCNIRASIAWEPPSRGTFKLKFDGASK